MTAHRAGASSGGSLPAPNWCLLSFDTPDPLTPSNPAHTFSAGELHIVDQSGTDFSVQTVTGHGAVVSAAGGFFQAGAAIGCPPSPTLDASSAALRYLWFSMTIGPGPGLGGLGYDSLVPIFPPDTENGPGAALQTVSSLPGVVAPGAPAAYNPTVELIGGVGTDSVPLDFVFGPDTFPMFVVWQIG